MTHSNVEVIRPLYDPEEDCPFCGEIGHFVLERRTQTDGTVIYVRCIDCDCRGPESHDEDSAINSWNQRKRHEEWESLVRILDKNPDWEILTDSEDDGDMHMVHRYYLRNKKAGVVMTPKFRSKLLLNTYCFRILELEKQKEEEEE